MEPVHSKLEERIDCEFWPEQDFFRWVQSLEEEKDGGWHLLNGTDLEPYNDRQIDIGQYIYETIVAAIDPYPRKSNVEFDWGASEFNSGADGKLEETGPFSKLKAIKDVLKDDKSG